MYRIGVVAAGHALWEFLQCWPALTAAVNACAAFEGVAPGTRPLLPDKEGVRALGPIVVREAPAANRMQLTMLRVLKRCILSDIE